MDKAVFKQVEKIAERLKKSYQAEKVILYGSHARGDATKDSDVDLFIIAPTNERFFERMARVLALVRDLRKGIPIEPIVLTEEEVKNRIKIGDQFVQETIENGVYL